MNLWGAGESVQGKTRHCGTAAGQGAARQLPRACCHSWQIGRVRCALRSYSVWLSDLPLLGLHSAELHQPGQLTVVICAGFGGDAIRYTLSERKTFPYE